MSRMTRAITLVVVILLVPAVALAAQGVFDSNSAPAPAVIATNTAAGGTGVFGRANAGSGASTGVWGISDSTSGTGVYGSTPAASGVTAGVFGESHSTSGRGVYGRADAGTGFTYGVYGESHSTSGTGVYGLADAGTGFTYGVYGQANSSNGTGVVGNGGKYGVVGTTTGDVIGNGTYGVFSINDMGLRGHLTAKSGNVAGTCTVAAGTTSKTCGFPNAFAAGTTPMVVVSPKADPVTRWWVSGATTTGFTLRLAAAQGAAKTFTYLVVGKLSTL